MFKKIFIIVLLCSLLASVGFSEDLNPRSIERARIEIIRSGTLDVQLPLYQVSLYLYIPQEFEYLNVEPSNWEYTQDDSQNKMIKINWIKPKGDVNYKVTSVVDSYAKKINGEYLLQRDNNTEETPLIKITDSIREIAYGFDNSLKGTVEMSQFVNQLITYNSDYGNLQISSEKVLKLKEGVCTEYSNLLLALLRAKKISSRAVTGYAYSTDDKNLIGHAWVEVLTNKGWVGLDPTWNEAGYIDATHIKIASLSDTNQSETISYAGKGSVKWTENKERFRFINYTTNKPLNFEIKTEYDNNAGYIELNAYGCAMLDAEAKSCIDNYNNELLDIKNSKISSWVCPDKKIYWFFTADKGNYRCPVNVFTPFSMDSINITVDYQDGKKPVLNGPDYVLAGEEFVLSTNADDFIIYSPQLNDYRKTDWILKLKPGVYTFYLYDDGLIEKNVTVLKEKEFSITINHSVNVTLNSSFILNISIQNLLNRSNNGVLEVEFQGIQKRELSFKSNEIKIINLNLTAADFDGKISASISDIGLYSISSNIDIVEQPVIKKWWQRFFEKILKWLGLIK